MPKAYLFLRKVIALCINILVFFVVSRYNIPFYYSLPVILIIFSLICSRILGESPKELYNFKRSETFFNKGGIRDLLRIPVVLFAFIHDIIVWELWGLYQVLLIFVDAIYFIKEFVFWILHGIIWFIKQLIPFWRLIFNILLFYFLKWPWWIYRYAFKNIKKAYNWNIIRISLRGSIIALIIFQFFYFLDISLNISGLFYIGIILAMLPVSWIFGEIASVRGQKLMKENFHAIKLKFGNGMETVRGVLFFLTFLVVLLLAEAGLDLLGWLPKTGIIFLGIGLNISFLINIAVVFLAILVVIGSLVLPTYRLYNEFSETNPQNIIEFLGYIFKRILQIIAGFIPSSFFAAIAALPLILLVTISLFLTIKLKNNIIDLKINKVIQEQYKAEDPTKKYLLVKQLEQLNYIRVFPKQFLEEMKNRPAIQQNIEESKQKETYLSKELAGIKNTINLQITDLKEQIDEERQKTAINETRIEELSIKSEQLNNELLIEEITKTNEINKLKIDSDFLQRKYNQLPLVFYLSTLFVALVSTLIFIFIFGYYGNFLFAAFIYRNDGTPTQWKEFIKNEQTLDSRHPLLSVSLNSIIMLAIIVFLFREIIWNFISGILI